MSETEDMMPMNVRPPKEAISVVNSLYPLINVKIVDCINLLSSLLHFVMSCVDFYTPRSDYHILRCMVYSVIMFLYCNNALYTED